MGFNSVFKGLNLLLTKYWLEYQKERRHFGATGIDGRMCLREHVVKILLCFSWVRIGFYSFLFFWGGGGPTISIKGNGFLFIRVTMSVSFPRELLYFAATAATFFGAVICVPAAAAFGGDRNGNPAKRNPKFIAH